MSSALRTLAGSAVGAVGARAVVHIVGAQSGVIGGLAALVVFGVLFAVAGWGLRSPELDAVVGAVGRRLRRG
jgi:hypothetical protein